MSLKEVLKKVIITAIVIGVAAFFTPGWQVSGFGTAIVAGAFIGLINYILEKFAKESTAARGIIGFIVTLIVLKVTAYAVDGFTITTFGAIIGSIVVGIVDSILPGGYI